jgi:organic radical activating enzyme
MIKEIDLTLPVMESFYTIQGEGFHQGKAAYFIRLAGCDVGCHWCDVKESWDAHKHPKLPVEQITQAASQHPGKIAVITGGEPLMYDLTQLCQSLKKKGMRTHIETSGAYEVSGSWDWFCLSPKKFKEPLIEACQAANELKVIVFNASDFVFAEKYRNLVSSDCKLYLQPEWDKREQVMPLIIDFVKENPQWQVSLQIHKYLQVP